MARMPGVEWVGEHGSVTMTEASLNKVCIHTIVGNPPAHAAHFSTRADGHIYQSRDTRFQSGANLNGNDDVIAIENDDTGPEYGNWDHNNPKEVPYFTTAQIEAIAKICAWAYHTHGIPLVACPDSKDSSEGIAYHRQGIDGNFIAEGYAYPGRVPGGEVWTKFPGKACPGDRRISQMPAIIHRARVLAGLETPIPSWMENDVPVFLMRGDANFATYAVKIDPELHTVEGEPTTAVRCYIPPTIGPALLAAMPVVVVPQAAFDAIAKVEGSA